MERHGGDLAWNQIRFLGAVQAHGNIGFPSRQRGTAQAADQVQGQLRILRAQLIDSRRYQRAGRRRRGTDGERLLMGARQLPKLLSRFCKLYPDIQLELTAGLSHDLLSDYENRQLDVVIAKRKISPNAPRGRIIWREPLVWIATKDCEIETSQPVRLVMMRPPCAYRAIMIEALASVRREWTSACLASNLMGVQVAVAAGLGITALGTSLLQEGMRILKPSEKLPTLPSTEVTVMGDDVGTQHLVQPLVSLLTEGLMSGSGLT